MTTASESTSPKELTYGQLAVGVTFNPSRNPQVDQVKQQCADLIDTVYQTKLNSSSGLQADECEDAIKALKTAQMWVVKAITRGL